MKVSDEMWFGGEAAITNTATKLTSLLSLAERQVAYFLDMRALPTNAGFVFIGPSSVTASTNRRAYLAPGETYTFESIPMYLVDTDDVYAVGTGGDKIVVSGLA